VILDPEAIGDDAGIGIDVCREGADLTDQVFGGGMAVIVGDVRAQPTPQRLDCHQVRTVPGSGMRVMFRLAAADQAVLTR
jgi:hypothetical protein